MRTWLISAAVLSCVVSTALAEGVTRRSYADRNGTILYRSVESNNGHQTYYSPYGQKVGSSTLRDYGNVTRRTYGDYNGTRLGTVTEQKNSGFRTFYSPQGRKVGSSTRKR